MKEKAKGGEVQKARALLMGLASEIVIRTTNPVSDLSQHDQGRRAID
ncbi:MAG: hypothetical protein ACREVK_13245 [Gammaproteobacteria bacterium]